MPPRFCDLNYFLFDGIDHQGKSPAHYAAKYGSLNSLKMLIRNTVDVSSGVMQCYVSLHSVIYNNYAYMRRG